MAITDSPLRYPGGKTQLSPFVAGLLSLNHLDKGVYAEPFAGGAGIALKLLYSGRVSEIWLNDIDRGIYSIWKSALDNVDELCARISDTPVTMENWYIQRKILFDDSAKEIEIAFATLFLNRTNRSGIIAGGVIGGKEQKGDYKLDCRFNKVDLIEKIRRINRYRDVIRISRKDANKCIKEWEEQLPKRSLLNIDPPYYGKGQDLYTNFYKPADHTTLSKTIRDLRVPWMLTYDDEPEIEKLYSGFPTYRKSLVYFAQTKRRASELLFTSKDLKTPTL